jgi:hypothetical protein
MLMNAKNCTRWKLRILTVGGLEAEGTGLMASYVNRKAQNTLQAPLQKRLK